MAKKSNSNKTKINSEPKSKLKVIALGGINEIGKNMTAFEYEDDIIVVDCGLGFPDDDMLGVDLVIPDVSYLEKNHEKIKGILLTHGHEDHIGALPYVLRTINPPIYGTKLTVGIVESKLKEHSLPEKPVLNAVSAGDTIKLGCFSIEFIRVNHSIADACCLAIKTPVGTVIHSGDFKLDLTPIEGEMMNITRLGEYGNEGVLLLMCESTNAEHPGFTPSERNVGRYFEDIFMKNASKRIVITTFSSNVHRLQQIINISVKYGRKVAITGRSMLNIVGAAVSLGYMNVPDGVLVDINEIKKFPPEQITIVTTGSQGEPMSALYRMTFSDHDKVELGLQDLVVISATAIPGNEKLVGKIINELFKKGVTVLHDALTEVHVSGHACQEEIKLMHALTKPKFFIPIHGEYRHLNQHLELAKEMGMPGDRMLITDIGKVVELDKKSMAFNGSVPSGKILVDGYGIGDVGNIVLRDRKHLSQDGLIVVVATLDLEDKLILSGPDIVSRGFVYVRESETLMDEIKALAKDAIDECFDKNITDWTQIKTRVKEDISKYLYSKTKRKPMLLPIITQI